MKHKQLNEENNTHQTVLHARSRRKKIKWYIVIGIIALFGGVALAWNSQGTQKIPSETFVVSRGSVAEEVVVTGRVKPAENVNLAFERGGKIRSTNIKIGDRVSPGQALVYLDTSELQAQLLQAEANVDVQNARLDELKKGTRTEEVQIKETELKKAEQDLANLFGSVSAVVNDAYSKADDAVRTKTDAIFNNDDSDSPQMAFLVNDAQAQINATSLRKTATYELRNWEKEIKDSTTTDEASYETILTLSGSHLSVIRNFLLRALDAVDKAAGVPQTNIDTYKTNLGVARANVNASITAVTSQLQSIAAQKVVVERIRDELALQKAGSTPESIAAQEAQVKQAEASVANTQAQVAKATLISPIKGIVTVQDAKAGEIVGANISLVSVISDVNLEIEANIPEVDIGHISVGNVVHITLDAFPNESFLGRVSYIDPAETVKDGVVNFKVTITFDVADPKIRSGFTANLNIETVRKENALVIPQFAIIENDQGVFVRKWENKKEVEVPVKLGIRGGDGLVEVISGLQEGDVLINIGVKNQTSNATN